MLTDANIKAAKARDKDYNLADTRQPFLHVTTGGGHHWRMNYTYGKNAAGKPSQKTLTFGADPGITLIKARALRDDAKGVLREGATQRSSAALPRRRRQWPAATPFRLWPSGGSN